MRITSLTLGLLFLLGTGSIAQAPAEPVLSAEQQAVLRAVELEAENAVLRLQLAQARMRALAQEWAVDGYTLERGEAGWRYVAKP